MNHTVEISLFGQDKCFAYADRVVEKYQNGQNETSRACQVPGREIDSNVDMQAMGRMAEAAFCKWLGVDPNEYLDWTVTPDGGADLIITPFAIDVKASPHPEAQYLIWPVSKRDFIHQTKSNILVLVRKRDETHFEVAGWTTKKWFMANRETASQHNAPKLDSGTWFMRLPNLWDPESLRSIIQATAL